MQGASTAAGGPDLGEGLESAHTERATVRTKALKRHLAIQADVPLFEYLRRAVAIILYVLVGNKLSRAIFDLVCIVGSTILITDMVRGALTSTFEIGLLFVIASVLWFFYTIILTTRIQPFLDRWISGPPVFGKYGGAPKRLFFFLLRTTPYVEYTISPAERVLWKRFSSLDREISRAFLKETYRAARLADGASDAEIGDEWPTVWRDMEAYHAGGFAMANALSDEYLSSRVIPFAFAASERLVAPFMELSMLIGTFVSIKLIEGSIAAPVVATTVVALNLLIAMLLFLFHAKGLAEITIMEQEFPSTIPEQLRERYQAIVGKKIHPSSIKIDPRYLSEIRNAFLLRQVLPSVLVNSIPIVGLTLLCVLFGMVQFGSASPSAQYLQFIITFLVLAIASVGCFLLAFLALQHLGHVAGPMAMAGLTALVPFAVRFALTGSLTTGSSTDAVASGGGAVVVGIITAVFGAIGGKEHT